MGGQVVSVATRTVDTPPLPPPRQKVDDLIMTIKYLALAEVAKALDIPLNTAKTRFRTGLLPEAPITIGTPRGVSSRGWDEDNLNLTDRDADTEPTHYLSAGGIGELLNVSVNTSKWWNKKLMLPEPDVQTGYSEGWSTETAYNWWNNDHPAFADLSQWGNRYDTYTFDDVVEGGPVGVLYVDEDKPVQVTAEKKKVRYVSAADALNNDGTRRYAAATTACWFIPDANTLSDADQRKLIRIAAEDATAPVVLIATAPLAIPAKLASDVNEYRSPHCTWMTATASAR